MKKTFLELGNLGGTHGGRGELKLDPWTDSPEVVSGLKTVYLDSRGEKPGGLVRARPHKRQELLTLEGIDSLEKAEELRGIVIYAKRDDIPVPEGRYFVAEILGCTVVDADSPEKVYGKVPHVENLGASDFWEVTKDGKKTMMPIIPGILANVDTEAGVVKVRPIPGIFDDAVVVKGE